MRSFLFPVLLVAIFIVGLMSSNTVFAQEGAGITMRPATIEEQIDPGQTKTFSVTVRNESDTDQIYYLGRRDIIGVRDGSVPVYADEDIAPTEMDMSQWIILSSDSISVPARGETPIQFSVTAPQNAAPGSHFAGIFISVEPPKLRESGAAIGYEVANIVTMRVAGEVNESATIRQFSTDNYLYGSPRVSFNVKIENDGNTLVRPTGPLQITNMFGKEVSGGLVFNEAAAAVFPGDTREYILEWLGEGYGFGRYEAIVSPVYGEEGSKQTISSTVIFWILPMKIVGPALGALLVLLLIAVVGVKLYVRRKLSYYHALGGRRLNRRQDSGNPILLIFLVMMTVTALFFIILLVLFS